METRNTQPVRNPLTHEQQIAIAVGFVVGAVLGQRAGIAFGGTAISAVAPGAAVGAYLGYRLSRRVSPSTARFF